MRHKVSGYKLSRSKDHRTSLRRTLIKQLFEHERIQTTITKAKAIQGDAEKLITLARNSAEASDVDKVNARRLAAAKLGGDSGAVKKLFEDLGPRYTKRTGGYTRILKLGPRLGDQAEMALIELVEE